MQIPLKYKDNNHKFALLIEAYNPVLRLKKREKEVLLGYLLQYHELYLGGTSDEDIQYDLFSTKTRQYLREEIGMSEPSYNNHIHQLKKKGILVEGKLMTLLANAIKFGDFVVTYKIDG